ncbi:MAG: type II toxin-antitoxin system VapC family toxin [Planctomycetota bacterium]|jgi:predicted nucleic acid-binding protein
MILVDTSVWVEVFRRRTPLDLESLVDFDGVVTCLPVVQEVLQGFREEAAFRKAEQAMFALPMVESPLTERLYREAIDLFRTGRGTGHTVRSSVDCLIAACALRHDLLVLHRNRDFSAIARFSRLREREVGR